MTTELPGADLVTAGIADLRAGRRTQEAFLVSIGAARLRRAGIEVPTPLGEPHAELYRLLAARHGDAAHSRYNALVRRLVSFERAAELLARTHA